MERNGRNAIARLGAAAPRPPKRDGSRGWSRCGKGEAFRLRVPAVSIAAQLGRPLPFGSQDVPQGRELGFKGSITDTQLCCVRCALLPCRSVVRCVLSRAMVRGMVRHVAVGRLGGVDTEQLGRVDSVPAIVGARGRHPPRLNCPEDGRLACPGRHCGVPKAQRWHGAFCPSHRSVGRCVRNR